MNEPTRVEVFAAIALHAIIGSMHTTLEALPDLNIGWIATQLAVQLDAALKAQERQPKDEPEAVP